MRRVPGSVLRLLLVGCVGCGSASSSTGPGVGPGAGPGADDAGVGDGAGRSSDDAASAGDGAQNPGNGAGDAGGDAAGTGSPAAIADGPVGTARVPGWDPNTPRALTVLAHNTGSQRWIDAPATIAEDGTVDQLVNVDRVIVFAYAGGDPAVVFDDVLGSSAKIAGWDASTPAALIALARYAGSRTWTVTMPTVDADGTVGGLVGTDRVVVWRFAARATAYDGALAGAKLSGWSATSPAPVSILARYQGTTRWVIAMASIEADGTVDNLANVDRVAVWRF